MKVNAIEIDNEMEKCEIWFNSEEAAEFLKIDRGTLLNFVSNGIVPYYKLGRSNRYLKSELEKMLRTNPKGERLWE